VRALAKSKGETLLWRECLPIRESKRLEVNLKRWEQRRDREVEREDEDDIPTDDEKE
jgi:hypothetical protein